MKHRHAWLRCLLCLLPMLWWSAPGVGAESAESAALKPQIRSQLSRNSVRAGERVMLDIAVLVPGWFTAPLDLPASFELDGATVRLADGAANNLNERMGGQSWAGIQRRYEIVPGRAGDFAIPQVPVSFAWSNGAMSAPGTLRSAPLRLSVRLPPGMEALDYFIASPRYRISQQFDRALDGLRVGDALTRTISQQAVGLRAMQLPALLPTPLAGIATYPETAQLEDQPGERGTADLAMRRQRVGYVLQQAGDFELPGLTVRWFDTGSATVRTAQLPAVRLHVAAAIPGTAAAPRTLPVSTGAVPPRLTLRQQLNALLAGHSGRVAGALLLAAAGLCLAWLNRSRWYPPLDTLRRCLRERLNPPERRAYRRSLYRMRSTEPADWLAAIDAWYLHLPPHAYGSLQDFVTACLPMAGAQKILALQQQVHGAPDAPWLALSRPTAREAMALLKELRHRWRGARRRQDSYHPIRLPTLQPLTPPDRRPGLTDCRRPSATSGSPDRP